MLLLLLRGDPDAPPQLDATLAGTGAILGALTPVPQLAATLVGTGRIRARIAGDNGPIGGLGGFGRTSPRFRGSCSGMGMSAVS